MEDFYSQLAQAIISRQEILIGPLAWDQAAAVTGLQVVDKTATVVSSTPKDVIDGLIEQYENIFGQAAVEVSKDAGARIIPHLTPEQLPELLK